ncbi:carbohydrate ABC transporter permease [Streptomyces sp. NPDC096311]|uniref:carbohydrate ABC transporter permease n=1 Tax=Streptomyces sp. NPDC096311 TaxID=3366083 RepID=UPI0037F198FA
MVYALLLSFTNFDGLSGNWSWVGWQNYTTALHDPLVWASLRRTGLYAVIVVPLSLAGGLAFAVLLNQRIRAVGVFRTIFYLPSVVPIVATALMFKLMFDRDTGLINGILSWFGIDAVSWLIDPHAFLILVLLSLWGLGGGMVVFLAGLQAIPAELLEAASMDGAGPWRRFWHITLPLLSPMIFFQLVLSLIGTLQTLVQPLLMAPATGGNAGGAVDTGVPQGNHLYMVNVYAQFFSYQKFGYGAALLWILFLVILAVTVLVMRSSARWVYYEVDQDGAEQ